MKPTRLRPRSIVAVMALFAVTLPVVVATTAAPAAAEVRSTVPIYGGNISLVYMGSPNVPVARRNLMVQIADRSTCTNTPLSVNCNGIMEPGDRVVLGDNYMAWMDLTTGFRGGGGGLLRGLWVMKEAGTSNFNFKYLDANNRAINNLGVCQSLSRCAGYEDSGHELLVSPDHPEVASNTFTAGRNSTPAVLDNGSYSTTTNSVRYHFNGQLVKSNGSRQIGGTNSRINYNLIYKFYNNTFTSTSDPRNRFGIETHASIDVCGSGTGCGSSTPHLETAVSSWGAQWMGKNDSTELRYFKPKTHFLSTTGGCTTPVQNYPPGSTYGPLSDTTRHVAETRAASGVGIRLSSTSSGGRKVDFNSSSISSSTVNLSSKTYQHIINDAANQVRVFDQKAGSTGGCGALGSMSPNQDIHFRTTIGLEGG